MRSELLLVGTLLGALIIIFSNPGPQLWTVAFLVVLLLYGLAFSDAYGFPWVEVHDHNRGKEKGKVKEEHQLGHGGWRHY